MRKIRRPHKLHIVLRVSACVIFFSVATILVCTYLGSYGSWWKFLTNGEIYIRPAVHKNYLFVGTSYGSIYAINQTTGKQVWTYAGSHSISSEPTFYKNIAIFATAGGELFGLTAKEGRVVWKFSTPNQHQFSSGHQIHKDILYISDTTGRIYAINPNNGKQLWTFESEQPTRLSEMPIDDEGPSWHTSFSIKDKTIFYSSLDGYVYALEAKTGALRWKFDTGGAITTYPELLGDRVYVGTKNGDSYALTQQDGRVAWKTRSSEAVSCLLPVYPFDELFFITNNTYVAKVNTFLNKYFPWRPKIIQMTSAGTLSLLDGSHQKIIWQKQTGKTSVNCPRKWFSSVYIKEKTAIRSIDYKSGNSRWTVKTNQSLPGPLLLEWRMWHFSFKKHFFSLNVPLLIVGGSNGGVLAFDGKSGAQLWQANCYGQAYHPPIRVSNRYYFACTDGGVYSVAARSGKISMPAPAVSVKQSSLRVNKADVIEFTITHPDDLYTNPFEEVRVRMVYSHKNYKDVIINGFFYDNDTWKVRFNPPKKGLWTWKLEFVTPSGMATKFGTFSSTTDTHASYFKINDQNPRRITLDQQTIFNGVGIGDTIIDFNRNGNPLDDWAIGTGAPYVTTSSGAIKEYSSDEIISLEKYADTYGPRNGGFNIFRWSINNAAFNLWDTFTFQSPYLITEGKHGDTLAQTLSSKGFHIWLTMFGFGIPFSDTRLPGERAAVAKYIEYIVARYGAYVSMWEIANEAYAGDEYVDFIANTIKSLDYERRPVAMSWEHPELPSLDVITPHRYVTENLRDSDLWMLAQIEEYDKYNKPILFGEMGNTTKNWDADSALRMRVKSWVAFFNEAILVFWNTSFNKNFYNDVLKNANQFIGPEERSYILSLQRFTAGAELGAKPLAISTNNATVRAYGLKSKNEILGYFFHFQNPYGNTTVSLPLLLPRGALITWYSPTIGTVIYSQRYKAGYANIVSPRFSTDIALKATFDQ